MLILKILYLNNVSYIVDVLTRYHIRLCRSWDYTLCKNFTSFTYPQHGIKEYLPQSMLASYSLHVFENTQFYVMDQFDKWLTALFGDYMKLPPIEDRIGHGQQDCIYYWK